MPAYRGASIIEEIYLPTHPYNSPIQLKKLLYFSLVKLQLLLLNNYDYRSCTNQEHIWRQNLKAVWFFKCACINME